MITQRTSGPSDPPELFSWGVSTGHECGVTGDRSEAIRHVQSALADAPAGTAGIVRRVAVGTSGSGEYVDLGGASVAWWDGESGEVVWTGGQVEVNSAGVDLLSVIPGFTVTRLPDGTWRARHVVEHRLVIERVSWPGLEAACCAARVARGLRAVSAQE